MVHNDIQFEHIYRIHQQELSQHRKRYIPQQQKIQSQMDEYSQDEKGLRYQYFLLFLKSIQLILLHAV